MAYTVFDADDTSRASRHLTAIEAMSEILTRGFARSIRLRFLTAIEAMSEILTYDGYRFEIRRDTDGRAWSLWHSDGSENSTRGARHMIRTVIFSLEDDQEQAMFDIAEQVCRVDWRRLPECMTDEAFDVYLAEVKAETDDAGA